VEAVARGGIVTDRSGLYAKVGLASAAAGLLAVGLAVGFTWPDNSLGVYLQARQNQARIVRALETRIAREPDPLTQAFYRAWLAEEQGDLAGAIAGFESVRQGAPIEKPLHLHATLRLGQSVGRSGDPAREIEIYRSLMERHPGASRLGQIFFHLRRDERGPALYLLEEALAQDARDGSLGQYRQAAREIRDDLHGPAARPGRRP